MTIEFLVLNTDDRSHKRLRNILILHILRILIAFALRDQISVRIIYRAGLRRDKKRFIRSRHFLDCLSPDLLNLVRITAKKIHSSRAKHKQHQHNLQLYYEPEKAMLFLFLSLLLCHIISFFNPLRKIYEVFYRFYIAYANYVFIKKV